MWAKNIQSIKLQTAHLDPAKRKIHLKTLIIELVSDRDLKSKIEILEDPMHMLKQIVTKLGSAQALQMAAKVRIASLPNLGTWSQQTANLNLAVLLFDRTRSGPGLESLDDELFSLMIRYFLSSPSNESNDCQAIPNNRRPVNSIH